MTRPTVAELVTRLVLEPLPREGGMFRQTWIGEERDGRPVGTAIIVLLAAEGGHFSAMHRLPIDEVWFFQSGDPIELLLLEAAGPGRVAILGPDVVRGDELQVVVPAGTWMGARTAPAASGASSRPRWRQASSPRTTTRATRTGSPSNGRTTSG